ncbi:hypothetical protein D3C78_1450030 [compost metagenome]
MVSPGHKVSTSCIPKPTDTSNNVKPKVAPVTCRRLVVKPNCAPQLSATMFTGPGVIEEANAKAAIER